MRKLGIVLLLQEFSIFCDNSELSDVASVCSDIFTIDSWKSSGSNLISVHLLLTEDSVITFEEMLISSSRYIFTQTYQTKYIESYGIFIY